MARPTTFELPTTDDMSGLLNAEYFRHLLREERVKEADESGEPLTVFLVDIDDFLSINVAHGREAGDRVILEVVRLLREIAPGDALLTRYGGDEFGGALSGIRLDDAFTLLEEFRRRVATLEFDGLPEVRVSCSVGLAAYPGQGTTDVELMREADQALYVAKTTGRNKVSLPLADSRMVTKTSHYTRVQLDRLAQLASRLNRNEASILREALDDALKKHNDRLSPPPSD
jgi:diguanylate cyclase (GGDEF)-like protein